MGLSKNTSASDIINQFSNCRRVLVCWTKTNVSKRMARNWADAQSCRNRACAGNRYDLNLACQCHFKKQITGSLINGVPASLTKATSSPCCKPLHQNGPALFFIVLMQAHKLTARLANAATTREFVWYPLRRPQQLDLGLQRLDD